MLIDAEKENLIIRSRQLHPLMLAILALAAIFIASIAMNMLYRKLGLDISEVLIPANLVKYPSWVLGLVGVIIAPLVETFVFQHGIKKTLNKLRFINPYVYIVVSASLFGATHGFGLSFPPAFIAGIFLAFVYQVRSFPEGNPFFYTWLIHFLKNVIAFLGTISL